MQGEAASADTEAVASYPDIAKIMKAGTLKKATVRTGHGITDWFQIEKGVYQG